MRSLQVSHFITNITNSTERCKWSRLIKKNPYIVKLICFLEDELGELPFSTIVEIRRTIEYNIPILKIKDYIKPYLASSEIEYLMQILREIHDENKIKLYINPELNQDQRWIVGFGFKCGLNAMETSVFANPIFSSTQMYQILLGITNGLTIDEINCYAKPWFDTSFMELLRNSFFHFSNLNLYSVLSLYTPSYASKLNNFLA